MPQLEQIDTFLSQIFWLIITFGILYFVLWRKAIPLISDVLQERQERVDEDLRKAEELKTEAEEVLAAYEKAVADGRAEAQTILRETSARLASEAEARNDELTRKIAADADAAEARIRAAREEALANIREVATDVAQTATHKLIGSDVPANDAGAAVDQVLKERG